MVNMRSEFPTSATKLSPNLLLLVLAAIGLIRAAPLYVWFNDFAQDNDAYVALAEGWAASGTYGRLPNPQASPDQVHPTAYRPPLYPLALSFLTRHELATASDNSTIVVSRLSTFAVAVLHWILGVATCVMTIRIANALQANIYLSVLSGFLVAIDPILVRQSTLVMTETLATFLSTAFLAWWACGNRSHSSSYLLGGFLMGLSILCRPTAAIWFVFLLAWLVISRLRQRIAPPWIGIAALSVATVLTLAPWIVRNQLQFGKPIWATTHGGYTLVLANNPVMYEHFAKGNFCRNWDEPRFHALWTKFPQDDPADESFWNGVAPTAPAPTNNQGMSEIEQDKLASSGAIATIRRHPYFFIESIFIRIGWLWAFWPAKNQSSLTQQIVIGAWYGGVFLTLLAASVYTLLYRRTQSKFNWQLIMPGLLLVMALTAVHSVYWSNMRMRSVAMPLVYVCLVTAIAATRKEVAGER